MKSNYRKQPTLAAAESMVQEPTKQMMTYGAQLPEGLQSNMEASFGQDFSNVRIHKNSERAKNMNALAFAQNEDVHFAPGQYNSSSKRGMELIGHELTHVVQQRAGVVKSSKNANGVNNDANLEKEADRNGRKAAKGEKVNQYANISSQNADGNVKNIQRKEAAEWPNPFTPGQAIFDSVPRDVRAQFRVIPENATSSTDVTFPQNGIWYETDGLWMQGRTDWLKIPDHVEVRISYDSDKSIVNFNGYEHWVTSWFRDGMRWVPDAGNTQHITDNPF